jgi:hypothetical protein
MGGRQSSSFAQTLQEEKMRQTHRLMLAAALLSLTVAPAFAQGNAAAPAQRPAVSATPATPAIPAQRPAAAATPANPGGSVSQAQPAQRPATPGTATQGANRATPAVPASPAAPAPRVTN